MKFVCITQGNHMTTFRGPSGEEYVSLQGYPFVVNSKIDIEYFKKNKRFSDKLKEAPKAQTETDKLEVLLEKAGLKPADQKKIIKQYEIIGNFVSDVQQGADLVTLYKLTKAEAEKITKLIEKYKG
jgi:hypothetical protein